MRTIKDVRDNLRPRRAMNVLRLASNVADAETITIGTEVYEIDTAVAPGVITAGNIRVDCNAGVTPAVAAPAIVAAINANTKLGLTALAISVNEISPGFGSYGIFRDFSRVDTPPGAPPSWRRVPAPNTPAGCRCVKNLRCARDAGSSRTKKSLS
jgi:hypothetical protein